MKKILAFVLSVAVMATMTPVMTFAVNDSITVMKNASNVEYYTENKTIKQGDDTKTVNVKTGVKSFDYTFDKEYDSNGKKKTRHYTDVSDNNKMNLDANTIKKVLTKNYDGSGSLLEKWANVGSAIMSYGSGINEKQYSYVGDDSYTKDYSLGANYNGTDKNNRIDVCKYLGTDTVKEQGKLGDDCARTTGLCYASSLDQVRSAAGQLFSDVIAKKMSTKEKALDRKSLDEALPNMKNTDDTKAYYSLVASMREPSCNKRRVNIYGICFYDFQVREIADDNIDFTHSALGYDSVQEAGEDPDSDVQYNREDQTSVYKQTNKSATEAGYEVATTNTHSETMHSTVSETYEFEEENNIGNEARIKIGKEEGPVSGEYAFTYNYRWQETWGSSKEIEVENEDEMGREQTTHVDMPPHTILDVNHISTTAEYTMPYSAPVEVLYKVVVFNLSGDVYADNTSIYYNESAEYKTADSTVFFGTETNGDKACAADSLGQSWDNRNISGYDDALKNCYRYYHKGTKTTNYSEKGVDWKNVSKNSDNGDITKVIESIDMSRPLLTQGADFAKTAAVNTSEVQELRSLYPIDRVSINDTKNNTGKYYVLSDCYSLLPTDVFKAIDVEGAEYYDFMEALGHWTIKSGEDVVSLDHDYDKDGIKASNVYGKKTGSAILRWEFDDPDYVLESEGGNVLAKNVKSMPEIGINVINSSVVNTSIDQSDGAIRTAADETVASNFKIKSSGITLSAGDDPVSIDKLVDFTGEIKGKREKIYTTLEVSKKPMKPETVDPDDYDDSDWYSSIDNAGKVKFTGPGTYTVSATVDGQTYSTGIKVGEERQITSARFIKNKLNLIGTPTVNMSSFITLKDQYGKKWTVNEWKNAKGMSDLKLKFIIKGPTKTVKVTKQSIAKALGDNAKAFISPELLPGKYVISVYKNDKKMDTITVNIKKVPGTKVNSLKSGKGSLKVSVVKQTNTVNNKHVSGYQIRYSEYKTMSGAKTADLKGYKKISKKINNLKSGKKYYVQARTYVNNKGIKVYGKWSDAKAATIR